MNGLYPASPSGQFLFRFVQESNEIEDLSIPDTALLEAWERRAGHMGAIRGMLELAEQREPLTVETLCRWQGLITREQLPYGHWIAEEHIGCLRNQDLRLAGRPLPSPKDLTPGLLRILEEISPALAGAKEDPLELAAATHWRFELLHPFMDGNGRTGRCLALYILRALRAEPVMFTAGDRESSYYRCFDSSGPEAMIRYFREHQLDGDPWVSSSA